jgi:hypothetical protein
MVAAISADRKQAGAGTSHASSTKESLTRRSEAPGSTDFATLEDDTIAVDDLTTIDLTRRHSRERNLADGLDFEKIGGKLTAVQTGKKNSAAAQASASAGATAGEVGTARAVVEAPAAVDWPPSANPAMAQSTAQSTAQSRADSLLSAVRSRAQKEGRTFL